MNTNRTTATDRPDDAFAPSRRNFLKLSIGALASLPAVGAGAFAVPWARREALADEQETTVRVVVVTARQIGLAVTDQTDGGHAPVEGATVTLYSRYNGKTETKTSDQDGVVVFDIVDYAEPRDDEDGTYYFNGTIDARCDGYRTFHMALGRLEGGKAMVVPTRQLEPDRPYPVTVSFDEWDVLYTKNVFAETTGNTDDHTLHVELAELPAAATISLYEKGKDAALKTASLNPSGGSASCDITAKFLLEGNADALTVDGEFYMEFTCNGYIYTFPIALGVMQGAAPSMTVDEDTWLAPNHNSTTPDAFNITLPDWIPLFGGQKFSPWTPNWKVTVVFDPFGYLYLAWKSPRVGYVSDDGSTDPKRWGKHTYEEAGKQFTKAFDKAMDTAQDARAKISKGHAATQLGFTKAFTCCASLRAEAAAKWDWVEKTFSGYINAQALLEAGVTLTEQFAVGPVPFFISFNFSVNFVFQFAGIGFQATDATDFSTYDFDFTNTGCTATLNISSYLAAGAGLSGIASVGARGCFAMSFFLGLTVKPGPQYPFPHLVMGINVKVMAEVQLFLFKWSGTLKEYNNPRLKDNWDGVTGTLDAPVASEYPGEYRLKSGGFSYVGSNDSLTSDGKSMWEVIMEDMEPVTSSDLAGTMEAIITYDSGALSAGEDDPVLALTNDAGEEIGTLYAFNEALAVDAEAPFWTQETVKQPSSAAPLLGVDHVDMPNGGIWPEFDREIMNRMFSDPRMKVVATKNPSMPQVAREYIFRISSVKVNGEMRTRLVHHVSFNGAIGPATVVEFQSGYQYLPREDCFDYDFDVVVSPDGTDIYAFLVSGPRPEGDATSMEGCWVELLMTYIHFKVSSGAISGYQTRSWVGSGAHGMSGDLHTVFCPRIAHVEGSGDDSVVAMSWLHRYSYVGSGSGAAGTSVGSVVAYRDGVAQQNFEPSAVLEDPTAFDLVMNRGARHEDGSYDMYFVPRGEDGTMAVTAKLSMPDGGNPPTYSEVSYRGLHDLAAHLTPWPENDGFLTSYEDKLQHVTLGTGSTVFNFEETGVEQFGVNSFGIDPTGTFVYYTENRSGGIGREYSEDGGSSELIEADENRLMACKIYSGTFTDPYVLANVEHPMENIVCLAPMNGAMTFLSAAITDFSASEASLWLTAVPCVACFTLLAAAAVPPVVAAGDSAHILLTIRNDGNVHLTGAQVTVRDDNGTVMDDVFLPFNTATLQTSAWNPPEGLEEGEAVIVEPTYASMKRRGGDTVEDIRPGMSHATPAFPSATTTQAVMRFDGNAKTRTAEGVPGAPMHKARLLGADPNGELPPGKTGVYAVEVEIPADWEDDHYLTVTIGDPEWVAASTLPGDEEPIELTSVSDAGLLELGSVPPEAGVDDEMTQDAPVTVRKADDEPGGDEPGGDEPGGDDPPSGGGEGGGGGGGGSDPHVPPVGDTAGPILGATAALAALSAGFAAYSARRTANERERMNDGEEC